jgi:putative membrane protein
MFKTLVLAALASAVVYSAPVVAKAPAMVRSDAAFLAMAAQADMTMAHIGKMAQDRAATNKVKDFANTLVQDHTSDYQRLTELAAKVGDTVPKAIDERNRHTIAELDHKKGKTFDHAFLTRESVDHEKLISAFKWEAEHGSNPDIKAYANQTLPTIERHLHDSQDLQRRQS